ncbi:lycopene cyclase family protein [Modestobacter sp. Leaf380]|uniref:lycopene cyclase family protein n=1 Tax=Modestobacter sp. Leaf380 TaxID=1736356 RepID=UPI0006F6F9D5|nr:lycopene cyclase family protein [Modestobacter sp. Leaf380]KQS66910.1 hypothetical protein ASG41_11000 [Modestobacter sp. Leaf380]
MLGAGPAGLATAVACAARGLTTTVLAPSSRPWTPTYGAWADELEPALDRLGVVPGDAARVYDATVVRTRRAGEQRLGRRYARLREGVLHAELTRRAEELGVVRETGSARGVDADGDPATVWLADGRRLTARVVVDARGSLPGTAQQRAWGELVAGPAEELVPAGTALLMDWSALRGDDERVPLFLYGLPREDGTTLLEATSLAARPPVSLERLRLALHRVLDRAGLRVVGEPERVAIALDAPARSHSDAVPVGAAAGMVHPATGYSVASSLALAPVVAAALASGGLDAVRRAVRTPRRRATAALLAAGREALLPLDAGATDDFFAGFFALPEDAWAAYLSTDSGPGAVAAAMARSFTGAAPAMRLHLVASTVSTATRPARRALRRRG